MPVLLTAVAGLLACSGDKDQPVPSTSAASASGTARPASAGGKTVHIQRAQGECTFDLDAPEELKEATKDGMSFTLESASFEFVGYEGTTLHSKPEHALDMLKGQYKDVFRGTENGIQLAIVTPVKNDKPATDKAVVSGMGGEPYKSERPLGCTFACSGVAAREADVVAMCKSVRITVKPAKNP